MPSTDRHSISISAWLTRRPATIPKLATTVTTGGGVSGATDTEKSGIDPNLPGGGRRHLGVAPRASSPAGSATGMLGGCDLLARRAPPGASQGVLGPRTPWAM